MVIPVTALLAAAPGILGAVKPSASMNVNQSTSVSSLSGVSLSISNILPGGTGGPTLSSTPQSANPVASNTPEPAYASSPAWGAFPDTAYSTAMLDTPAANSATGTISKPIVIVGIALLGAVAMVSMAARRGKR